MSKRKTHKPLDVHHIHVPCDAPFQPNQPKNSYFGGFSQDDCKAPQGPSSPLTTEARQKLLTKKALEATQ